MAVDMDTESFEQAVRDALDAMPEALMRLTDNVVVLVEDYPPPGMGVLLGLWEGHALTDRGVDYTGALPDAITIFRVPTLAICASREEVVAQVAVTVVHELGHHFGLDDARLHELGWE